MLLQLADEKKVQLDDPVAKYLPFVPNGQNITLRMLANMTGAYYLPANKAVIVVMVNSDIPVGKTNPMPLIFKALTKVVTPGNVPQ